MLNMDYLLQEAKNNGLPMFKKRAVVREYLHIIILNSIYKHRLGKKLFFMGGTAMRYFYHLPRFSEDLDFNTSKLTYQEFKEILKTIKKGVSAEGFSIRVSPYSRDRLFTAEITLDDVIQKYGISDQRSLNLMIKVEINRPLWEMRIESKVLSMYGYHFTAILMSRGNLLSEKMCALLNRRRGRDIYDTLFMLREKFPFNESVLKTNGIHLPAKEVILSHLKNMDKKDLRKLANQVKPFLFKEEEIDLILNAPLYAEKFLSEYP